MVAEKKAKVGGKCIVACTKVVQEIQGNGRIVIDDKWLILNEYKGNLLASGQPGVGNKFLKWVLTNRRNAKRCSIVSISPQNGNPENFDEFPIHTGLNNFDPSDRKFVATANAHPEKPPIVQGTDSKWWGWKEPLLECNIRVLFPCEEEIKAKFEQKQNQGNF